MTFFSFDLDSQVILVNCSAGGSSREEGWRWPDACSGACRVALTMSRLMLGRTLERICKAVLLLCLVHFLIMMILYFDVYSQRFDIFSRFNNGRGANGSRGPHHYNFSRPNTTFASYVATADHLLPSAKPDENQTPSTPKPLPPCPEIPPGLGRSSRKITFAWLILIIISILLAF